MWERNISCLLYTPSQGFGPETWYVPWLGMELSTFWWVWTSWATAGPSISLIYKKDSVQNGPFYLYFETVCTSSGMCCLIFSQFLSLLFTFYCLKYYKYIIVHMSSSPPPPLTFPRQFFFNPYNHGSYIWKYPCHVLNDTASGKSYNSNSAMSLLS